jgi:hypothetical protein
MPSMAAALPQDGPLQTSAEEHRHRDRFAH